MKPLSTKRFQLKRAGLFAFGMLIANGNFVPLHAAVKTRFPDLEVNKAITNTSTERHKAIENILAYNSNRSMSGAINADIIIKGKITDSKGQTLPGVNVIIKDSQKGTASDAEGNFQIVVGSSADVLVFSFIGYKTQQVIVGGKTSFDITMQEDNNVLDEVVVTALGISREKKSLGYSTQQVKGEILNESPASNFVNNLSGKIAGVNISGAGGVGSSARIVIRGESSLSMQSQPLFIIDGVPVGNDNTNNSGSADYGNSASEINPADIESVNVLKGPAAAALYGSRAARGAIVITTKKGSNRKGVGVSFNSYIFGTKVGRLPKFQNQFGQGNNGQYDGSNFGASWSAYPNGNNDDYDESWGPRMDIGTTRAQFDSPTTNGYRGGDVAISNRGDVLQTPWVSQPNNVKDFFTTGKKYYNNIAFSGGNEHGDYRLSLTSLNEKGVIPNNNLDRYQVNLNSSYKLSKKLTSSININYVRQTSDNRPDNGYGRSTFMYFFTWMGRNVNMNSLKNYWQPGLEGIRQYQYNYGENHNNPFFLQYQDTKGQNKDRVYGNVALEYAFTDHLKLKARVADDFYNDFRPMQWAVSTVDYESGRYEIVQIKNEERNADFLLTYNNTTKDGNFGINVSAGGNRFDNNGHSEDVAAPQLLIPGVYSIGNTGTALTGSSSKFKKRINSLYGTANLNYKDYVYLDVTARNDWSSTLPAGNNSYFYPSVSVNGNLKSIFNLPEVFSQAQLRGSWAKVGNDTGPYALKNTYNYASPWGSNYALVGTGSLLNPKLKPEIITTYEIGTAVSFFQSRLGFDVTYYNALSKNQIISLPSVQSSGATSRQINAGEIRNKGVEVVLNFTPIKTGDFKWNITVNWSHNVGKLLSLTSDVDKIVQAAPGEDASIQARVGQKMGSIWGPGYQRVPDGPMKGNVIIFNDSYPRGTSEDIYLGNYHPDWTGGIYNQLTYKGLSLNFMFGGQYGGKFVSRFYNKAVGSGQLEESAVGRGARAPGTEYDKPYYIPGAAQMADGSYQPNNTSTDGTYSTGVYGTNARYFIKKPLDHISEAQLFSSTYFKLRELSIGYSLPAKWLANGKFIKTAKISVTGRNLFLITPKSNRHFDPEVTTATDGSGLIPGFENMSTPSTREMGVSLNFDFLNGKTRNYEKVKLYTILVAAAEFKLYQRL